MLRIVNMLSPHYQNVKEKMSTFYRQLFELKNI